MHNSLSNAKLTHDPALVNESGGMGKRTEGNGSTGSAKSCPARKETEQAVAGGRGRQDASLRFFQRLAIWSHKNCGPCLDGLVYAM